MARRRFSPSTGNISPSQKYSNNEPSQFGKFMKFLLLGVAFVFLNNFLGPFYSQDGPEQLGVILFAVMFFVRSIYHLYKSIIG